MTARKAPTAGQWAVAALAAAAFSLCTLPALADPASETALRTLVSTIDASPDWNASFQGLSSDASGAAVLTGLHIESATAGMTIDADTLSAAKASAGNDGRYAASKVTAGSVTIAAGALNVTLANVALDDLSGPGGLGFAFDPAKPFSSIIRVYGMLAKAHLGQGHVAALAVTEQLATTTSRVTYNDVTLARLDGGHITTLSAGPLVMQSPVPDKSSPKPLVDITVSHADAKDIDLAGLLRVYDTPQPNAPRAFAPAVSNVTYKDATIQLAPRDTAAGPAASITVKIAGMSLDDFRVRPPERSVAADLDRSVAAPFAEDGSSNDPAGMLNILSAYSVGHFTAGPIDVTATGIDTLHLDSLSLANASLDSLGEFALSGLNAGVKDFGSVKAARIAVGGMTFPHSDVLAAGIRAAASHGDVDLSAVTPAIGYVEIGGVDVGLAGFPSTRLGKFRVDLSNYLGNVPTSAKLDISGVDLDAALMPGIVREQLAKYGYTRVLADLAGTIAWNEGKKTTTISGLKATIKDVGSLGIDATLNGPERSDIQALTTTAAIEGLGDKLSLVNGTISFKDDSIVGRVLSDQANGLKVDPDKFRDQFARGLPFMLLPVGSADFQKKASPVLQDFIRTPGTISIAAAPAMPIPLPALIAAAKSSGVFNLPTTLNLSISGTPGAKPAVPVAPAPAPAAPAPAPGQGASPVTPAPN